MRLVSGGAGNSTRTYLFLLSCSCSPILSCRSALRASTRRCIFSLRLYYPRCARPSCAAWPRRSALALFLSRPVKTSAPLVCGTPLLNRTAERTDPCRVMLCSQAKLLVPQGEVAQCKAGLVFLMPLACVLLPAVALLPPDRARPPARISR